MWTSKPRVLRSKCAVHNTATLPLKQQISGTAVNIFFSQLFLLLITITQTISHVGNAKQFMLDLQKF